MKPAEKISLAQRIHMASPGRGGLPNAVGLCDVDFFEVIGELTGLEEEYQSIYQSYVAPYANEDGSLTRIYHLVERAEEQEEYRRQDLLYWVLVEPFVTLYLGRQL